MATRWKRENRTTLVLMHAHNKWSTWNDCLIMAAMQLGLPIGEARYPNCSGDGSLDDDTYTLTSALVRAGGIEKVNELADGLHKEEMTRRSMYNW